MSGLKNIIQLPVSARWIIAGTIVTTLGNALNTLSIAKVLYDHTGSAAAFGGVIIFEQVVTLVLQLIAGPWVDRGHPKATCMSAEFARGVLVCIIAVLCSANSNLYFWVMLMTLIIRLAQPFYRASLFSLVPSVIEPRDLTKFNSYSNIATQVGQLAGLAIAAPLLVFAGPAIAFFLNGLTFLFSGITIAVLQVVDHPPGESEKDPATTQSILRQISSGWGDVGCILRKEKGFAWHLLLISNDLVAVNLFNLITMPLIAWRFAGSTYGLSLFDGFFAVGSIAIAPLTIWLEKLWSTRRFAIIGIGLQSLSFALFAVASNREILLAAAFLIGAANTLSWTALTTALQVRTPREIRGRIGTVRNMMSAVVTAVLLSAVSRLEAISPQAMMLACALVCLIFTTIPLVVGRRKFLGKQLFGISES